LPVTLGAQPIYSSQHPPQKLFGGFGGDARPLEVLDLLPLPQDLAAHVLDFRADMLDLAKHIVSQKTADFEPERFEDHYEEALTELINAKRRGKTISPRARPSGWNVVDLMDALKPLQRAKSRVRLPSAKRRCCCRLKANALRSKPKRPTSLYRERGSEHDRSGSQYTKRECGRDHRVHAVSACRQHLSAHSMAGSSPGVMKRTTTRLSQPRMSQLSQLSHDCIQSRWCAAVCRLDRLGHGTVRMCPRCPRRQATAMF
jgi:hypothetical protein